MKQLTENAVSPVVGVMLMLVVVIIIAAVVSAFAGGLGTNTKKAPQVSLEVTPVIQGIQDQNTGNYVPDYPAGFTADNGLLF
ncbi:MAG: type IV pilin, partial [Methanoregula sp.]|nr:type IV pilin [Methanoregula sp.]